MRVLHKGVYASRREAAASSWAGAGPSHRREFCHLWLTLSLSPSLLEHLLQAGGGAAECQNSRRRLGRARGGL